MKKILTILILNLFAINIVSSQNVTKITSVNLNLRTGPETSSEIITVIPKGTTVQIYENCECVWIPVIYNGKIGYVSSKFLQNRTKKLSSEHANYSRVKHYTNSNGERVQSPTYYNSVPAGATALCRDGTYSFSRSRRGTCSHHGGVAQWY